MMQPDMSAREVAVSGLRAQRMRMNVIANNIANAETTRTPGGKAFRRQLVMLRGEPVGRSFDPSKGGVRVKKVVADTAPLKTVFNPSHPDANKQGYVEFPNVNLAAEMVDLVSAQRAYEANVAVIASGSRIQQRALEILQG
jgi:flagellar basal-body rod protein FlgC